MYAQNSTSAINPGFCDINCCTSYWKAYFLILHFLLSISNVFPVIEMRLSFWIPPDNNYLCRLFEQNLIDLKSCWLEGVLVYLHFFTWLLCTDYHLYLCSFHRQQFPNCFLQFHLILELVYMLINPQIFFFYLCQRQDKMLLVEIIVLFITGKFGPTLGFLIFASEFPQLYCSFVVILKTWFVQALILLGGVFFFWWTSGTFCGPRKLNVMWCFRHQFITGEDLQIINAMYFFKFKFNLNSAFFATADTQASSPL